MVRTQSLIRYFCSSTGLATVLGTKTKDGGTRSTALRFKHLHGFKVHGKSDGKPHVPTGSHRKIQSDASGILRVTKKNYDAPRDPERKDSTSISSRPEGPFKFGSVNIPPCVDHLPDGVDLTVLDDAPKQRTASVTFSFVLIQTDLNHFVGFSTTCLDGTRPR